MVFTQLIKNLEKYHYKQLQRIIMNKLIVNQHVKIVMFICCLLTLGSTQRQCNQVTENFSPSNSQCSQTSYCLFQEQRQIFNVTCKQNSSFVAFNRENCRQKCCQAQSQSNQESSMFICSSQILTYQERVSDSLVNRVYVYFFAGVLSFCVFATILIVCIKRCRRNRRREEQPDQVNIQTQNQILHEPSSAIWMPNQNPDIKQLFNPSNICVICQQNKVNMVTKCGHTFHVTCLASWIRRKRSCPLCQSSGLFPGMYYCVKCLDWYIIILNLNEKLAASFNKIYCINCK